MRILLAGDTHGDGDWFTQLCLAAQRQACSIIVVLGDFGFWEHTREGVAFLKHVSRELKRRGLVCYALDGNHENFEILWDRERYPANEHGLVPIRDSLFYLPRGHRWTWDGVTFMSLGGAYSIDKDPLPPWWRTGRRPGKDWWPEETITEEDVERAIAGGPVDVMLTHDCPWGVDIPTLRASDEVFGKDRWPQSALNRMLLRDVVAVVRPVLLAHGHYHDRYNAELPIPYEDENRNLAWHPVQIVGLDCNWQKREAPERAWTILDTDRVLAAKASLS